MSCNPHHVPAAFATPAQPAAVTSDWRTALPVMGGTGFRLRELRLSDAASLLAMLTTEEVTRFISPPPSTVNGFERFIEWTHRERTAGTYLCFGIVPDDSESAVGIVQVRQLEPGFGSAEWGFALGSGYWGTGLFVKAARLVVSFAFDVVGVHRLEARSAIQNGRGNGALRKIGANLEGVLRKSFLRSGDYLDQNLWTLIADDWKAMKPAANSLIH